ncbi:hypothetical protein ACEQ8H_001975 [Pleosporales sp. CAS-2024a]
MGFNNAMRTTITTLLPTLIPLASSTLIAWASEFELQHLLQSHDRLFISFTSSALDSIAPLNAIFEQAATNLSTPFVTIDCNIGLSLCASYDIASFPTFRLLERHASDDKDGQMATTRYRGPRTMDAFHSFIKKRELPVVTKLGSNDMKFKTIDDTVFIAFLDASDKTHIDAFSALAAKYHYDYAFAYTTDALHARIEQVAIPGVICFRALDGDNLRLEGAFTLADGEKFVAAAKESYIKDFREKDVEEFGKRDKLTVYVFAHLPHHRPLRHTLVAVAKKFQQHVTFAMVDLARYPDMPGNFGTEIKAHAALIVHAPLNDQIFRYSGTKRIETDEVDTMLLTILQGRAVEHQVFGAGAKDADEAGAKRDKAAKGAHDEL